MKTILVIIDNTLTARHAIGFVLAIAQQVHANILLANTVGLKKRVAVKAGAAQSSGDILEEHPLLFGDQPEGRSNFKPEIEGLDISAMNECKVAELINKRQAWMMVMGMSDVSDSTTPRRKLNIHAVLSKVLCPLLIVPESWPGKAIKRLVYLADLRYCLTQIVRYLVELARPWKADVSIANLTAKGLPDMAPQYALSLFEDAVCKHVNYDQLFINNIREKNTSKVVDVLINGLHNDVLVLVNRQFHFEEIIGSYITDTLPEQITIPLLIFPY